MNRRSFLKNTGLVTGAALPLMSSNVFGAGPTTPRTPATQTSRARRTPPNTQAGLDPFTGTLTLELALHLLRRTGFGPRYAEATAIVGANLSEVVNTMLTDQAAPNPPDTWVTSLPDYTNTSTVQQTNRTNTENFREWWMNLIYSGSSNPLLEKMVLFWANHFVSETAKVQIPQYIYWQNTLFRQMAFGNFQDFVKAVTIDNAMVWYLDGYTNTKNNPNENYARELMELFTIGPTDTTNLSTPTDDPVPNYTQYDITQAARALTGYIMVKTPMSTYTSAVFQAAKFDSGANKQFMTQTGNWGYTDIVDIIFQKIDQPTKKNQVALFICTKLFGYFVYDDPGDPTLMTQAVYNQYCNPTNPVIQAMADTFVANSFSIKAVLRQLLTSNIFFDPNTIGAQYKSPVEFMIAATRQMEILTQGASYLVGQVGGLSGSGLNQMNQPPNVKGFPGYRSWVSTATLPSRNQITDSFFPYNGGSAGTDVIALSKLIAGNDANIYNSASSLVQAYVNFVLPMSCATDQLDALTNEILSGASESDWSITYPKAAQGIQNMISILLRFAEFQLA